MNIGISAAYSFSNFVPAIVGGSGYSKVVTLVMLCPTYLLAVLLFYQLLALRQD